MRPGSRRRPAASAPCPLRSPASPPPRAGPALSCSRPAPPARGLPLPVSSGRHLPRPAAALPWRREAPRRGRPGLSAAFACGERAAVAGQPRALPAAAPRQRKEEGSAMAEAWAGFSQEELRRLRGQRPGTDRDRALAGAGARDRAGRSARPGWRGGSGPGSGAEEPPGPRHPVSPRSRSCIPSSPQPPRALSPLRPHLCPSPQLIRSIPVSNTSASPGSPSFPPASPSAPPVQAPSLTTPLSLPPSPSVSPPAASLSHFQTLRPLVLQPHLPVC